MNLYFRLFWVFFISRFKSRVSVFERFITNHRVMLNDVDIFGHMNNGRYFTISDIARIEYLIQAGIWQEMKKRNIFPVIAGETIQLRKPLKPFQKYAIHSKTIGWDKKFFYLEHTFRDESTVFALMIVKVRIVGIKSQRVAPHEVLEFVQDQPVEILHVDAVIENWNLSTETHWNNK